MNRRIPYSFTFSTMAAAVANQAAATGVAVRAIVLCLIQLIGLKWYADGVSQVKVLRSADKIQSGLEGLLSLFLLAATKAVVAAVFYEVRANFDKGEGNICLTALIVQRQHPVVITWPGTSVVFPTANYLLDKAFTQIRKKADRADKRSTHNSLMTEGKFFQVW